MKQINGFTLIEMLFSLIILASLLLIAVPSMNKLIESEETKQFFQLLEADLFLIQNQALGTNKAARIVFSSDHYLIYSDFHDEIIRRDLPEHLMYSSTKKTFHFSNRGTIMNPGTYLLKDGQSLYNLILPLGKGRHYIESP